MRNVHVQYFALLREQRGRGQEMVATAAATAAELYAELQALHRFSLGSDQVRVAVDGEFAPWTAPLTEGARLVFMPPVAGG